MPTYDLQCTYCGTLTYDYINQSYKDPLPLCARCNSPQEKVWSASHTHRPFAAFEIDSKDAQGKPTKITIDSLGKLRQVEADSLRAYREGRGQPIIFRAYSQNPSNCDQNVFGMLPPDISNKSHHSLSESETRAAHALSARLRHLKGR